MKYIKQDDFYKETNGKIIDIDGLYGGQCWDLFSYYTKLLCGKTFPCIETGYVIDFWNTFDTIGLNEYFVKVTDNYQDGDWLIWKAPSSITTTSHIAMFRLDNKDGTNVILTQNPNGNPNYTHQMICDYIGVVGALRPKIYISEIDKVESVDSVDEVLSPIPVEPNEQVNQVIVKANDTIYCRTSPDNTIENKVDDNFVKMGYYNVLDEIDNKGYHWYKIADNRYIAQVDGYVEFVKKSTTNKDDIEINCSIIKKIFKIIKKFIIKIIKNFK